MGYHEAVPLYNAEVALCIGGNVLDVPVGADPETATLGWLVSALEQAREGGSKRLVGYLEAVADDLVFEAESAARQGRIGS